MMAFDPLNPSRARLVGGRGRAARDKVNKRTLIIVEITDGAVPCTFFFIGLFSKLDERYPRKLYFTATSGAFPYTKSTHGGSLAQRAHSGPGLFKQRFINKFA